MTPPLKIVIHSTGEVLWYKQTIKGIHHYYCRSPEPDVIDSYLTFTDALLEDLIKRQKQLEPSFNKQTIFLYNTNFEL